MAQRNYGYSCCLVKAIASLQLGHGAARSSWFGMNETFNCFIQFYWEVMIEACEEQSHTLTKCGVLLRIIMVRLCLSIDKFELESILSIYCIFCTETIEGIICLVVENCYFLQLENNPIITLMHIHAIAR